MTWLTALIQWWRSLPRTPALDIIPGKGWPRKNTRKREEDPDEIILHESVTRTRKGCHGVLKRRGLSVEYTGARDGSVHQHVKDVTKRYCLHSGGKHNKRSIAIEVINRYYGKSANKDETVIKAHWAHKKKYILPTPKQLESVWKLVCHLDTVFDTDLRRFPGIHSTKGFCWGRSKYAAKAPGTKAHHRWHHADALFVECYCACRDRGLSAVEAFEWVLTSAQAGKRYTPMPAVQDDEDE